jgi:exopolysaccharide production protein ExoZ
MSGKGSGAAGTKLRSLEVGRFLAAVLVFICHLASFLNARAATPGDRIFGGVSLAGPLGLQYFFVLSGFVMAYSHHRDFGHAAAIPRFWWRRACRIYPTYWLALAIPLFYLYKGTSPAAIWHLLSLQPVPFGPRGTLEYIQAAWSLRYEMAFYIILGLGMLPYIGKPLLALWVFVSYWRWCWPWFPFTVHPFHPAWLLAINGVVGTHAPDFISYFQYYFFAGLVAGVAFAKSRPSARLWALVLAAGLGGCLLLLPDERWGATFGTPIHMLFMAAAMACIIGGLAGLERCGVIRLGRYAAWAGAMSYPIYLFHEPLMMIAGVHYPNMALRMPALYAYFAVMVAVTLPVAALAAFLFDMPVQRILRRLTIRLGWA